MPAASFAAQMAQSLGMNAASSAGTSAGEGSDANVPTKVYFSGTLNVPFLAAHPMAVCPSSPDRFSRLMPPGDSGSDVDFPGVKTIPQLAVATRLQEYKDLIGASGSRYSDISSNTIQVPLFIQLRCFS